MKAKYQNLLLGKLRDEESGEGLEREGGERLETIEKAIKSTAENLKMIKEDWNQEIKDRKYDKIKKQMRRQLQMFRKQNRIP